MGEGLRWRSGGWRSGEEGVTIDIITIFPELIEAVLEVGTLRIAREQGAARINVVDLREFTDDRHRSVDDAPFGGGPGMILKPDPIFRAVREVRGDDDSGRIVLLSPQGKTYDQRIATALAEEGRVSLICGRYRGVDERVRRGLITDEISLGDYVLSGGELAALVVAESVVRLLPGVIGDYESAARDSFQSGLLDAPHYTRPQEFEEMRVPEVLVSGDHAKIERWRRKEAIRRTLRRRPDLLERVELTPEDRELLRAVESEDQLSRSSGAESNEVSETS
jgi:tRNA (guanine37-N1)-methyltransferase